MDHGDSRLTLNRKPKHAGEKVRSPKHHLRVSPERERSSIRFWLGLNDDWKGWGWGLFFLLALAFSFFLCALVVCSFSYCSVVNASNTPRIPERRLEPLLVSFAMSPYRKAIVPFRIGRDSQFPHHNYQSRRTGKSLLLEARHKPLSEPNQTGNLEHGKSDLMQRKEDSRVGQIHSLAEAK